MKEISYNEALKDPANGVEEENGYCGINIYNL